MKRFISIEWSTAEYMLLGVEWIEGEAENINTGDVGPCQMLTIGFLFFSINITFL